MILAVLSLAPAASAQSLPTPNAQARAQALENSGRCRGPDGKDATDSACKGAGAAPAASSVYRLDSQGKCRDAKGRLVKADKCGGVENAPSKAAAASDKQ
jgi:hypothetical protein